MLEVKKNIKKNLNSLKKMQIIRKLISIKLKYKLIRWQLDRHLAWCSISTALKAMVRSENNYKNNKKKCYIYHGLKLF